MPTAQAGTLDAGTDEAAGLGLQREPQLQLVVEALRLAEIDPEIRVAEHGVLRHVVGPRRVAASSADVVGRTPSSGATVGPLHVSIVSTPAAVTRGFRPTGG